MKKLKEKVLKTIILLTVVSSTLPFFYHDVYADTITSANIIGINRVNVSSTHIQDTTVNVQGLGQITLSQFEYEYEITVLLDDYYLGYINGSFSTSLNDVYWGTGEIYNRNATKQNMSYYVNGNSFTTSFTIIANMRNIQGGGNIDPTSSYSTTFSLNTSNVTKYQDINGIDTIISILNDIENNTDLEVNYLNEITKFRQYTFPFESFMFIYPMMLFNYTVKDLTTYYSYQYPIFALTQNNKFCSIYASTDSKYRLIFFINKNIYSETALSTYLTPSDGVFSQYRMINRLGRYEMDMYYLIEVAWSSFSSNGWKQILVNTDIDVIPIFFGDYKYNKFSTDFALIYGLSNQLLDDLHIISQGTQSSNTSSSELEDNSSDFDDVAGDVYNLENSFNTGLNNSLQQIDTSFDVGNTFGSKFLLAADWVRVQFNTITESNPFGTILSFSLLLGVALLIIGKVLG